MQNTPSNLYALRITPNSGRALFATQHIPANTLLLHTPLLSASVIHREYRREVCAYCFAYDRGRSWPVRDVKTGLVWCREACRGMWHKTLGEGGYEAHVSVEDLLKRKRRKEGEDLWMVDADADREGVSAEEVRSAWDLAEMKGRRVMRARDGGTKVEKRTLREAFEGYLDYSIVHYMLSGVLCVARGVEWKGLQELCEAETPYRFRFLLDQHVAAYLHLLCVLPRALLEYVTPENVQALVSRDAHNAFGIRSLDDGSELLGHGVWPEASYWNHSCDPNLKKRRDGRAWEFWTARDVEEGEELCITYLGGEEKTLDIFERRKRLKKEWGFDCECIQCRSELAMTEQMT